MYHCCAFGKFIVKDLCSYVHTGLVQATVPIAPSSDHFQLKVYVRHIYAGFRPPRLQFLRSHVVMQVFKSIFGQTPHTGVAQFTSVRCPEDVDTNY